MPHNGCQHAVQSRSSWSGDTFLIVSFQSRDTERATLKYAKYLDLATVCEIFLGISAERSVPFILLIVFWLCRVGICQGEGEFGCFGRRGSSTPVQVILNKCSVKIVFYAIFCVLSGLLLCQLKPVSPSIGSEITGMAATTQPLRRPR